MPIKYKNPNVLKMLAQYSWDSTKYLADNSKIDAVLIIWIFIIFLIYRIHENYIKHISIYDMC